MFTRVRHSLNTITSLMMGVITALVFMMAVAGGASAGVTGGLSSGPLVAPLSGSSGFVSPFSLIRNGVGSFGSFSGESPQALTVDQATGDIYAMEPSTGKLWRFDSTGAPKNFTAGPGAGTNSITGLNFGEFAGLDQIAVDSSSGPAKGDIYVTESGLGRISVFAATGALLGTLKGSGNPNGKLGEDCGVAVDQSNGDVYIASRGFEIWRYSPTSSLVSETDYSGGIEVSIEPCQLAVAGGSLYAKQWQEFPILGAGPLEKYETSAFTFPEIGFGTPTQIAQNVTAVATDPATGDVYADLGNQISVFDQAGSALYAFGSSSDFGSESSGVAMNSSTGNAYVADRTHQRIDVYGAALVAPPTATTGQASEINHVKATLNGHLDLNGGPEITDCHFDWGTTTAYGNTTPCTQGNNYTTSADVTATITGLEPGKTYHYRLSVTNTAGTATGADQALETSSVVAHRAFLTTIGPDGTSATSFSVLRGIAFRPSTASLYALDQNGIYGFDASAPPAYTPLAGFSPLVTSSEGDEPGFAVDTTKLSSAGNLYFVSEAEGKIYGFASTGAALGGAFPIDAHTTPGAPAGSPADLCGAAVDSTGQIWVSNYATRQLLRYSSAGAYQGALDLSAQGLNPCHLAFDSNDDLYVTDGNGSTGQETWRYTASSGYTAATLIDSEGGAGLAFNPTNHHLFIASSDQVREYDSSHNLVATFADNVPGASYHTLAVDPATDHIFLLDRGNNNIRVYGLPILPPQASIGSASAITNTTTTISGTVGPLGFAVSDCHFEYATENDFRTNGFTGAAVAPCNPSAGAIPADLDDHTVSANVTGLAHNTTYHYRLIATTSQGTAVTIDASFTTTGPAEVETVGSPIRTSTTALLDGRVDPRGAPTTYHFEYGDLGPCDSNPCTATASHTAGSGNVIELVSQQLTGLQPGTTYHYRLLADNSNPDGLATGADHTVTTRASDAPLTHGHFPGPPDSDRAWEQVNAPDLGGNSVLNSLATSSNGERVVYGIEGGNPGSQNGGGLFGASNYHLAERTASGWKTNFVYPARAQATGNEWTPPAASNDLSRIYDINRDGSLTGDADVWSLSPGQPARELSETPIADATENLYSAADGSRIITVLDGARDPEHPLGQNVGQVYDVTSGTPRLVAVLPDGSVPCRSSVTENYSLFSENWVLPDGSRAFFYAYCGDEGLYVRNFANSTTTKIAGAPNHKAVFLHATNTAVFFTTDASLDPHDEGGIDVYRYDLVSREYDCVTCFPGHVGKIVGDNNQYIAVSDDGSRVYFAASARLLPGAAAEGIYRVDVASHDLAYVAPGGSGFRGLDTAGIFNAQGKAISPDGSVFVFRSDNPALNALGGQQNGGTAQYYRYDDRERSLVCASCPGDGSVPVAGVGGEIGGARSEGGPNQTPLDDAGDLAFTTSTPLVSADQNTARSGQDPSRGDDLYEWRDGRLLLVTDGTSNNQEARPVFNGFSRDGRDLFFAQYAQLTPDALDSNRRIYDARIGGGFEFPQPPPPCPLDACQGNPVPAPFDSTPASSSFSGPGNESQGGVTTTTRTKTPKQVKCKKGRKGSKCSAPVKCKKGKKGRKCRKARHANTIRGIGR